MLKYSRCSNVLSALNDGWELYEVAILCRSSYQSKTDRIERTNGRGFTTSSFRSIFLVFPHNEPAIPKETSLTKVLTCEIFEKIDFINLPVREQALTFGGTVDACKPEHHYQSDS